MLPVVAAGVVLAPVLLLFLAVGVLRRRPSATGASESLLPVTIRSRSQQGSMFGSAHSLWPLDGGRGRSCMPCTCDCGAPSCEPTPCSRSAAAEAVTQVAELEKIFATDDRVADLLRLSAEVPPSGVMYVPDASLFARKLIAECGTARASLELLEHARAFREQNGLDGILRTSMPEQFLREMRAVVPHGLHKTDRWGHPLYIERIGQIVPKEMAAVWAKGAEPLSLPPAVRARAGVAKAGGFGPRGSDKVFTQPMNGAIYYHFQMVEYARLEYAEQARLHGRHVSKMVSIIDLSDLRLGIFASKACLDRLSSLSKLGDLLTVENLAAIWVVNAPWFFAKCWQAVSHLLMPRTAEKLRVLSPRESAAFLLSVVPAENLPSWLGGSCACEGGCVSAQGRPSAQQREYDARIGEWGACGACEGGGSGRAATATAAQSRARLASRSGGSPWAEWLQHVSLLRCFFHRPPGTVSPGRPLRASTSPFETPSKGGASSATPSVGESEEAPSHELEPLHTGSAQAGAGRQEALGGSREPAPF